MARWRLEIRRRYAGPSAGAVGKRRRAARRENVFGRMAGLQGRRGGKLATAQGSAGHASLRHRGRKGDESLCAGHGTVAANEVVENYFVGNLNEQTLRVERKEEGGARRGHGAGPWAGRMRWRLVGLVIRFILECAPAIASCTPSRHHAARGTRRPRSP